MRTRLGLHRRAFPGRPAFDTAVSRALLARAEAEKRESLRLYRPDDVVAFSILDRTRPGFLRALRAAEAEGFGATLRLAGGRAAIFHRETLAFAWCVPAPRAREGIQARFETLSQRVRRALGRLGVDARVGEVAGEYCPGAHSVNARGCTKLMGVGQRVLRDAAHVGGVLVVSDSDRVRQALAPVYAALGFDWDPAAVGSVEDEIGPVAFEDVAEALLEEFRHHHEVIEAEIPEAALLRAEEFESAHRAEESAGRDSDPGLSASGKGVIEATGRR